MGKVCTVQYSYVTWQSIDRKNVKISVNYYHFSKKCCVKCTYTKKFLFQSKITFTLYWIRNFFEIILPCPLLWHLTICVKNGHLFIQYKIYLMNMGSYLATGLQKCLWYTPELQVIPASNIIFQEYIEVVIPEFNISVKTYP